jgi:hypothetical protein
LKFLDIRIYYYRIYSPRRPPQLLRAR